ncbi:maleylpyruvate isomerase N-terminal domain-containing protein [Rhodococcus sp. SGAir0479]|uniref:maleylpyruvate isomerase N-terminal domain-containing protein n=1 Tax=Rhodococcus sp. SGAir0479 TaxID=2567884 RepID=UPI0010CCE9A6|nr:maleylpyruvate isomerase N-terminal domain-containing protein [Rhodococcus sp. SGAir0479]QCQ90771.1 mycothiol maleylpyruvate isomerase [Rhodococcus sp. SGAir0479]
METPVTTYVSAARSFAALVRSIPGNRWDGPGLGDWDLRSLVGHTSRALSTVGTYLGSPADTVDIAGSEHYFARAQAAAADADPDGIVERGRRAGVDLGADPAAAVDALVADVVARLGTGEDRPIRVIGGLGIRLHAYLPTRTFELAVHSLDIAAALDTTLTLPDDVLAETTVLAARLAIVDGTGATVLRALTGRAALPGSFSVV